MSSFNPHAVKIRLEIEVPLGGGPVVVKAEEAYGLRLKFLSSFPNEGDPVRVKPTSATAGTICSCKQYATPQSGVMAKAFPVAEVPTGPNPPVPNDAAAGTTADQLTWNWTDVNIIPGAAHAASPGAQNKVGYWVRQPDGTYTLDTFVAFYGVTGTSGPCGSGSGSDGSRMVSGDGLFPVFWHLEVVEFPGPLTVFNAMWGLRQNLAAKRPTWDNRADGKSAVRVQLTEGAKGGWDLSFTLGDLHADYSAPRTGHVFGPIRFEGRKANVKPVGQVMLPAIVVSPV